MKNVIKHFAVIDTPLIENVLEPDFDYDKYVHDYYNDYLMSLKGVYQGYMEGLEDIDLSVLYDQPFEKKIPSTEDKLYREYEEKMEKLMDMYKKAYKRGTALEVNEQITNEMKMLASYYSLKMDTLNDTGVIDKLPGKLK